MQMMRALGARTLPVVARGGKFVIAQVIRDVVNFLGLSDDTKPQLSAIELGDRYQQVLETAVRLARQMPDDQLQNELPNRPRSWLVLMYHLFTIPNAFMDAEASGKKLAHAALNVPPPHDIDSSAAVADFGEGVRSRFNAWWQAEKDSDFTAEVEPYFGKTSRHELFERIVWHSTQHIRQMASLLEQAGVTPDRPLTSADIQGLPLTEKIWDE
jgi:uncharacterized damage-inducible protein DinB